MFCSKCGSEMEDNATFCNKCGAKNEDIKKVVEDTKDAVSDLSDTTINQTKKLKTNVKINKKLIGIIGGIIGGIVVIIIIAFFGINFIIGMKNPGRFIKDSNSNIQYKFKDGHLAKSEWVLHDEDKYYFNKNGIMQTNKWVDNDYFVDENGKMQKSCFIEDSGNSYYLKDDGRHACNELIDVDGKTYVFNEDGLNIKNNMYKNASPSYICYVNNDGYVEKGNGLTDVGNGSIYIVDDKTGELKTNDWIENDKTGKYSYFDENGWMVKNKMITSLEDKGEIIYLMDIPSNIFEGLEMYSMNSILDMKCYYVDENGYMLANDSKTIDEVDWQFDSDGVGKKLNWKSLYYTDTHEKYVKNKYYFEGGHISSLYDKGQPAYSALFVDNEDIAFSLYEGKNRVKNIYSFTTVDYECVILSKSFLNGYSFNGIMYKKGDRVVVNNEIAKATIKNLLSSGENFFIVISEKDSYWDEKYYFFVEAGNFAEIYNSTF